jgi:hypothetical protein
MQVSGTFPALNTKMTGREEDQGQGREARLLMLFSGVVRADGGPGQVVVYARNNHGCPRLTLSFISDSHPPQAGWIGFSPESATELRDALTAALAAAHTEGD